MSTKTTTTTIIIILQLTTLTLLSIKKRKQPILPITNENNNKSTNHTHTSATIAYFRMLLLRSVPTSAQSQDVNRTTLCYFCVSALDVLDQAQPTNSNNHLPTLELKERERICNWIYSRQHLLGGFDGGPFDGPNPNSSLLPNTAHIVSTYSALCTLVILGDDLSRVRKSELMIWLRSLQDEDGCFHATNTTLKNESDLRFLYAACAIMTLIKQDFNLGMDMDKATSYCLSCLCYDGGFGMKPGLESHGGAAYTATASLFLMNRLHLLSQHQIYELVQFCVSRQGGDENSGNNLTIKSGGFNGRIHKKLDTCYAFWVGAVLVMLRCSEFIQKESLLEFLGTTAHEKVGGYGKHPGDFPDPLHSYFGVWSKNFCLTSSSSSTTNNIQPLAAALGISERAVMRWKEVVSE
jgi:geranylgeranyl transferase type-1 subunit beta